VQWRLYASAADEVKHPRDEFPAICGRLSAVRLLARVQPARFVLRVLVGRTETGMIFLPPCFLEDEDIVAAACEELEDGAIVGFRQDVEGEQAFVVALVVRLQLVELGQDAVCSSRETFGLKMMRSVLCSLRLSTPSTRGTSSGDTSAQRTTSPKFSL